MLTWFGVVESGIPLSSQGICDEGKGNNSSDTLKHGQASHGLPDATSPRVRRHAKQDGQRRNGAKAERQIVNVRGARPSGAEAGVLPFAVVLCLGWEGATVVAAIGDLAVLVRGRESSDGFLASSRQSVKIGDFGVQNIRVSFGHDPIVPLQRKW